MKKINRNMKRDKIYTKELKKQGWVVLRLWEHEVVNNIEKAVTKILKHLS